MTRLLGKLTWLDRFRIRTIVPVSVGHAVRCSIRRRGVAELTKRQAKIKLKDKIMVDNPSGGGVIIP